VYNGLFTSGTRFIMDYISEQVSNRKRISINFDEKIQQLVKKSFVNLTTPSIFLSQANKWPYWFRILPGYKKSRGTK